MEWYDWSGAWWRWIWDSDSVDDQDLMICSAAVQLARAACGVVASKSIPSLCYLRRVDLLTHDLSKHGTDLRRRTMQLALSGAAGTAVVSVPRLFDGLVRKKDVADRVAGREVQCTFGPEHAAPIIIPSFSKWEQVPVVGSLCRGG